MTFDVIPYEMLLDVSVSQKKYIYKKLLILIRLDLHIEYAQYSRATDFYRDYLY